MLVAAVALLHAVDGAFAQPPAGLIPDPSRAWSNATVNRDPSKTNATSMWIDQSQSKAILNWQRLNLAPGEKLHFEQQSADWSALNRIYDANPSLIQGAISAKGQIYLINQNGVIFGKGAQVNVGSLVASSLDVPDTLFQNGVLSNPRPGEVAAFSAFPNGLPSGMVVVDAGATLEAAAGGRIMLLAPVVSNSGLIRAPDGQVVLAAGGKVYLAASRDPALRGLLVEVDNGGSVENKSVGQIITERGNTTLVGLSVNQSGRISATTSVNLNGSIRLLARDSVVAQEGSGVQLPAATNYGALVLGEGSRTEVTPQVADPTTITDQQSFNASSVELAGRSIYLRKDSQIVAPAGNVSISAQRGLEFNAQGGTLAPDVRMYAEQGSRIDVAGLTDVPVSAGRNIVQVQLRGSELADAPLQRNGPLRGKTVSVDVRKGTPLADISGYVNQIGRGVGERSTAGGSVTIQSEGDIVLRQGSAIDVSGGSIAYQPGYVQTTKLVTADGHVVDISQASPDRVYVGLANSYQVVHTKWGITEQFVAPSVPDYASGYVEGKNAGIIRVVAPSLVLDGSLAGHQTAGPLQRDFGKIPLGGRLVIGDESVFAASQGGDFKTPDVLITAAPQALPAGFAFGDELPQGYRTTTQLGTGVMGADGFNRVAVYSNGSIVVDSRLDLATGSYKTVAADGTTGVGRSALTLVGQKVDVRADISVPAGDITLRSVATAQAPSDPADYGVLVAASHRISARGLWVNDGPAPGAQTRTDPVLPDAGSITIASVGDVTLAAGSRLDVTGGGWIQPSGALRAGNAGAITLRTGRLGVGPIDPQRSRLDLGATLLGYALGRGGSLTIDTSRVTVGRAVNAPREELMLAADFFQSGGFASYTINGRDALTVSEGTQVHPVIKQLVARASASTMATGSDVLSFSDAVLLDPSLRAPGSIVLSADGRVFGTLTVARGAAIEVDPQGGIALTAGKQLTVLGALVAPAGRVSLSTPEPIQEDDFLPGQSIWLGGESVISAAGSVRLSPNVLGLRLGNVLDAGQITISAGRGYVIAERGAKVDVSGAGGDLDISVPLGAAVGYTRARVDGSAGSISIRAQEGVLFDGTLLGQAAGSSSFAGKLSMSLLRQVPFSGFPGGEKRIVIQHDGNFVPADLKPGDVVDPQAFTPESSTLSHRAFVSASAVEQGGFDQVSLTSPGVVEWVGDSALSVRRNLAIDAPGLRVGDRTHAQLASAYVSLGNTSGFAPVDAAPGTGQFRVTARLVDFEGAVGMQGVASATIHSDGDIRLKGYFDPLSATPSLVGAVRIAGDLRLEAAQVYPTTFSDFTLTVVNSPDTAISIGRVGIPDGPVLSAAGTITIRAPRIVQEGVLKAPFGQIVLQGEQSVALGANSLTSVSGEGQVVLVGRTEFSGRDYTYALDPSSTKLLNAPPQKSVSLSAPSVEVQKGSVIDLSGGGDWLAYEFVPGPGGSRDVLDPANAANTFAILPQINPLFSAYDQQEFRAGAAPSVAMGDTVYLSGGAGVAAGYYALLPARYALLPGAYLVTRVPGTQDFPGNQATRQLDGSITVSGRMAAPSLDGQWEQESRSAGYNVRPGTSALAQSEFMRTTASGFFAGAQPGLSPADAGRLALTPSEALVLQGTLRATHDPKSLGAQVDVSAPRLAVVATGAAEDGFVNIDAASLNQLGAESILLGGARAISGGTQTVTVGASQVKLGTSAPVALAVPDLMVVSNDRIDVGPGTRIEARASSTQAPGSIVIPADASGIASAGLVLRVSSGALGQVVRQGGPGTASGGTVTLMDGAALVGSSILSDATADTRISPSATLSASEVSLASSRVSLGDPGASVDGLLLTSQLLQQVQTAKTLRLHSYSSVDFYAGPALGEVLPGGEFALQTLTFDGSNLVGHLNGGQTATVRARRIELINTGAQLATATQPAQGQLQFDSDVIELGAGGKSIQGFSAVQLSASNELVFSGQGSVTVAADTLISAGRIAADARTNQQFLVPDSALTVTRFNTGSAVSTQASAPDSSLAISARRLSIGGSLDLPGGRLKLAATGSAPDDHLELDATAAIDASGYAKAIADQVVYVPGGEVTLASAAGDVRIASGARIEVSGGKTGGDAGRIEIDAPRGNLVSAGSLNGSANPNYQSGSIAVDVSRFDDFSALNTGLVGAFGADRSFRTRTGDLVVGSADVLTARSITLISDAGAVRIDGKLDASGAKGGRINAWAGGDLVLAPSASVKAAALDSQSDGGVVQMGSASGTVTVDSAAQFDLSGGSAGHGGQVLFRAPISGADVRISELPATIKGAREIVVEAVRVYDGISAVGSQPGPGTLTIDTIAADASAFMDSAVAIKARLGKSDDPLFHIRPGVEIRSSGDLTLLSGSDWNLYLLRPGVEPGVLTLRAAGNLKLDAALSDGFLSIPTVDDPHLAAAFNLQAGASWSYRLVAGSDLAGAAPDSLRAADDLERAGAGDALVGALVRTGTGFIQVSAGRDIRLASGAVSIYTAGEPGPAVPGFDARLFRDVEFENSVSVVPVYPVNGGPIELRAQRDIVGARSGQLVNDWLYRRTAGAKSIIDYSYVNPQTTWWPRFNTFAQNVGTLGGGDVSVTAGRDVNQLEVVLPTNGRLGGDRTAPAQLSALVVQGGGDLDLRAGRDIRGGVFYVAGGSGEISAKGSILAPTDAAGGQVPWMTLALTDGAVKVASGGDLQLETVFNPTGVTQPPTDPSRALNQLSQFFSYSPGAVVTLSSYAGNVALGNNAGGRLTSATPQIFGPGGNGNTDAITIYPPTLRVEAPQGDVDILSSFSLFPGKTGNLTMLAAGSVALAGNITMLDNDFARIPQIINPAPAFSETQLDGAGRADASIIRHSAPPLHSDDLEPIRITAGSGDIAPVPGLSASVLTFPKLAWLQAGRDIRDINFVGQNVRDDSVSVLSAGRDISFSTTRSPSGIPQANNFDIELGGPGTLVVTAGRDVDLGASRGIVTRGALDNPYLPAVGASMVVGAGLGTNPNGSIRQPNYQALYVNAQLAEFERELPPSLDESSRQALIEQKRQALESDFGSLASEAQARAALALFYRELRETGRSAVSSRNYDRGYQAIEWLFPSEDATGKIAYGGDINLFFSQLKTEQGGDIDILAPGGSVNAGLANAGRFKKQPSQLGVLTLGGGNIQSFSRGDFQVNQSRVFTLGGGDILIWSSDGSIDAGKGAKTASATPPPQLKIDSDGRVTLDITQSIQGSGIGVLLGKPGIKPGDVDLIAPKGEVNAGDAGIRSAGNVTIAAIRVVGADNIQVGGVSAGVPIGVTGGVNVSAAIGDTAAQATRSVEKAMTEDSKPQASNPGSAWTPSFVTVEVIGIGEDDAERRKPQ